MSVLLCRKAVLRKNAATNVSPVPRFSGGNLRESIFMMQPVEDRRGPTSPPALPTPKEVATLPMPANYGLQSYYHQGILPGKESGQQNRRETGAIIGSSCPYLPFRIKCELSPEKEILSPQGCAASKTQRQKSDRVQEQIKRDGKEVT
jgi:hypothetical protein